MHESALTEELFEHVMAHAKEAKAKRITLVKVSIGALSDATAESITFYFNSLAPGTIAEGATLEFESIPGLAKCSACGAESEIDDIYSSCPKCNTAPLTVISGNGVYLSSIELETDDDSHKSIHE